MGLTVLPLKYLTIKSVLVEQWPLTSEKFQALEQLVEEKLDAQNIYEYTPAWNSPIFVVKIISHK